MESLPHNYFNNEIAQSVIYEDIHNVSLLSVTVSHFITSKFISISTW